jgi:hypothetical protein
VLSPSFTLVAFRAQMKSWWRRCMPTRAMPWHWRRMRSASVLLYAAIGAQVLAVAKRCFVGGVGGWASD